MDAFWLWFDRCVTVLTALGLVAGAVFFTRQLLFSRRLGKNTQPGGLTILNFSGHEFAADWAIDARVVDRPLDVPFKGGPKRLQRYLMDVLDTLPDGERARLDIGDPKVVVAFPSPTGASLTLDLLLHAEAGHFVPATWAQRIDDGTYVWLEPQSRQTLHEDARSKLRMRPGRASK